MHRGTAAPPSAKRGRDGDRGSPPPYQPPPTRGNRNQETRRATRAASPVSKGGGERGPCTLPPTQPHAPERPGLAPCRPAARLLCTWRVDHEVADGGEAANEGTDARPLPPLPPSRNTIGGTTASPWFAGGTARPPRCSRTAPSHGAWPTRPAPWPPSSACSLGFCGSRTSWRGAWNGWWHCGHWREDKAVWITAVHLPRGPEFGTKGATVGQALQCSHPEVLFARASRPDPRGGRLPYRWRKLLAPMWREETGEPLRRHARPCCVEQRDDPPHC